MAEDKKELSVVEAGKLQLTDTESSIVKAIIEENDPTKLKDLTYLFKINVAKKNIVRLIKYYDMIDLVNDQTLKRLENRPDEISNKDLLTFMNTLLVTIEKTSETLGALDDTTTGLTINQQNNEVNINLGGTQQLDRDSKERVIDAIKSIMNTVTAVETSHSTVEPIIEVDGAIEENEELEDEEY